MARITRFFASIALGLSVLFGTGLVPVHAAPLSDTQVQKVINLLESLKADVATIERVREAHKPLPVEPPFCYTFSANLKIGDTGAAVTALQKILAKEGYGVAMNGTFDTQTAFAVKAYQEKYAAEILTPHGLTRGTGFVGAATRARLNKIYGCIAVDPNPPFTLPFCGQPPMPVCSPGLACAQVMPQPKTYRDYESYRKDKAKFLYDGACVGGPSFPPTSSTVATTTPGLVSRVFGTLDYNDDQVVDQADTQLLLEVAVGSRACPKDKKCDLNRDGRAVASDALVLANYIGTTVKSGQFDYNNDFKLDRADVVLLQNVSAELATCGVGKVCDVDGDREVDKEDVAALTGYVGE